MTDYISILFLFVVVAVAAQDDRYCMRKLDIFRYFFILFCDARVYHIFFLRSILLADDMVAPLQQWLAGTLSRRSKYWRANVRECRNRGVYKSYLCSSISNSSQRPLRFCSFFVFFVSLFIFLVKLYRYVYLVPIKGYSVRCN